MPALLIATAFFIVFLWGVLAGIVLARIYTPPPPFRYEEEQPQEKHDNVVPFRRH